MYVIWNRCPTGRNLLINKIFTKWTKLRKSEIAPKFEGGAETSALPTGEVVKSLHTTSCETWKIYINFLAVGCSYSTRLIFTSSMTSTTSVTSIIINTSCNVAPNISGGYFLLSGTII